MSDFTFLTREQCEGDTELDVLKKRGTNAAITDFSILSGGEIITRSYVSNDSSLAGRTGYYWTKTELIYEPENVIIMCEDGYMDAYSKDGRTVSARPVLPFSDIESIPSNGEGVREAEDGVLEVEYGYYPQQAASKDMQDRLDIAYISGTISKTGNSYTTDSVAFDDNNTSFKPQTNEEYNYMGKRYVRVKANNTRVYGDEFTLSNGKKYKYGDYVWVEVQPVKWLVDEKAKVMTTDKLIFSGVRYNDIKDFMDNYLSKEMFQERDKEEKVGTTEEKNKTKRNNNNPYNLDFSEVSEEDIIRGALEANVSVFLHGKPGSGKSDRVKQLDPDFIELNLSHLDPELLDGLAGEKEGREVHIKPPWLEELEEKCKEEPEKIHILFLEELTNASPMMQSKAYGIALDKKVAGRWSLPENARVVAAGNELEDSLAANEIAEPLYDRFAHVNIETTAEDWLEWAVTPEESYERLDYKKEDKNRPKIHPAIYGYISYKGDEVLRTPYDGEHPQPHADPRRWKMASDMLYASNNPETLRAIVGEDLTRDFIEFCRTPRITIEDILNENYTEEDFDMDLGEKLATISGLVRVDSTNMPKVRDFVKKLGPEMCRKFEVQWAHGDEERLEKLQEIIMEEQEKENEEHNSEEAKEYDERGVLGFKNIEGAYQENLKENQENEINDK